LTGLREVLERLRHRLRTFRDERGRELFDLPDAPRPDPDTPAPSRFLPEYDNVLLSHADRSRFLLGDERAPVSTARIVHGTVLHDGFVIATWHIDRDRVDDSRTLVIEHARPLTKRVQVAITSEGRKFVRFHEGDAVAHDVRVVMSPR